MSYHSSRQVILQYNGKSLNYSEWAKETGIPRSTIYRRIHTGWSIEDALTIRPKFPRNKGNYVWMCVSTDEYELPEAVAATVRELAEMTGVRAETIRERMWRQRMGQCRVKYLKVELGEEEQ